MHQISPPDQQQIITRSLQIRHGSSRRWTCGMLCSSCYYSHPKRMTVDLLSLEGWMVHLHVRRAGLHRMPTARAMEAVP